IALIENARAVREARKITALGSYRPPANMLMCEGALTPACAQQAADRVQLPVAWLPPPAGYQFRWLAAGPTVKTAATNRIAFESLTSNVVDLELDSQPRGPWQPGNERLVGSYVENGTIVNVYQDLYGYGPDQPDPTTLTLRWQHEGRQYQLFVSLHYLLQRLALKPAKFVGIVASVKYATPR